MNRLRYGTSTFAIAIVVLASTFSLNQDSDQDALEQRVAGLEARVTALETQIASITDGDIVDTSAPGKTYTVTGFLSATNPFKQMNPPLRDTVTFDPDKQSCANSGSLRELHTGAKVVAADESGSTIATSKLELRPGFVPQGSDAVRCEYVFEIELPEFTFVTCTIGGVDTPTYGFDELVENGWEVNLSISPFEGERSPPLPR